MAEQKIYLVHMSWTLVCNSEGLVNFLPSISLKANTSIIVISQSIKALDLKMVVVASSATFHINVRCNNKSECACCDGVGCHVLC